MTDFVNGRRVFNCSALVLFAGFAGCATPDEPDSRPPLPLKPTETSAVIVGQTIGGILNNRVYVAAVNGEAVNDGLSTAQTPLRIATGETHVVVAQHAGGFNASVELAFTARPNRSYRARAAQETSGSILGHQLYSAGGNTFFWIEDYETGTDVSDRKKVFVDVTNKQPFLPPLPVKK